MRKQRNIGFSESRIFYALLFAILCFLSWCYQALYELDREKLLEYVILWLNMFLNFNRDIIYTRYRITIVLMICIYLKALGFALVKIKTDMVHFIKLYPILHNICRRLKPLKIFCYLFLWTHIQFFQFSLINRISKHQQRVVAFWCKLMCDRE